MKSKFKFGILILALFIACVIAGMGITILLTTSNGKFMPGTVINENKCGSLSMEELLQKDDLKLRIVLASDKVDVQTIDISSVFEGSPFTEESLKSVLILQERTLPLSLFKNKTYSVPADGNINREKLKEIVTGLKCVTTEKSTDSADAYIKETANGYEVIPEVYGDKIDADKLTDEIISCIKSGEFTINTTKDSIKKKPEVTTESEKIQSFKALIDNANNMEITWDFGDRQEKITTENIKSWQKIEEGNHVSFDEEKIKSYVKDLAFKYDTYQKPHQFQTTNQGVITIESKTYGWRTDINKTVQLIMETLAAGENAVIEPVYVEEVNYYLPLSRDENDIGNTYVEVSIQEQRAWLYKNGEVLVDTPIVTGMKGKNDTPTGLYCVWSREKDTTISNSHVDYWMPFDGVFGTGVGLHDASWKSSFGGKIYETSGSHGCVNLPHNAAQTIYNNIVAGTPVIVY